MTELTAAALVAMVLSFVVFGTAAAWYAVPWMRTVALGAAITPLLWIHAFVGVVYVSEGGLEPHALTGH